MTPSSTTRSCRICIVGTACWSVKERTGIQLPTAPVKVLNMETCVSPRCLVQLDSTPSFLLPALTVKELVLIDHRPHKPRDPFITIDARVSISIQSWHPTAN